MILIPRARVITETSSYCNVRRNCEELRNIFHLSQLHRSLFPTYEDESDRIMCVVAFEAGDDIAVLF